MPVSAPRQVKEPTPESLPDRRQGASGRPGLGGKAVIVALVLFLTTNAGLFLVAGKEKVSSDMWSGSGSIDLAVDAYKQLVAAPKVVLLGSSLVMFPFWAMDKEANAGIGDIFHHHRSAALEKALSEHGVSGASVFSFAIFGQMVSDAYIYVNEYLRGSRTPEYLVYGIAPRDFCDHDVPAPMATLSFKRLVDMTNFSQYALLYLPGFNDKIDFIGGRVCFFYGRRWKLQKEVGKAIDKLYAVFGIQAPSASKGAQQAGFMLSGSEKERWQNSLEEYRRRYKGIGEANLEVQMGFLRQTLTVCAQRRIKIVVVNMPLTAANRELFPPGFYQRFCREVKQAVEYSGAQASFVDLGADAAFVDADFWDTTHLNHAGGHKLVERIVPYLK